MPDFKISNRKFICIIQALSIYVNIMGNDTWFMINFAKDSHCSISIFYFL